MKFLFIEMRDETFPGGCGAAPMSKPRVPWMPPHPLPSTLTCWELQEGDTGAASKRGGGWNGLGSARCRGLNPPSQNINLDWAYRGLQGHAYLLRAVMHEGKSRKLQVARVPTLAPRTQGALCFFLEGDLVGNSVEEIRSKKINVTTTGVGEKQNSPQITFLLILYKCWDPVFPTTNREGSWW